MRGAKLPQKPLRVAINGKKTVDLVYGLETFLANERVLRILETSKFKGWQTYPVQIVSPKGFKPELKALVFTGRAGPPTNEPLSDDIEFDPKTWDGSDFFTLERTTLRIVTRRVIEALEKNGVTGAKYEVVNK